VQLRTPPFKTARVAVWLRDESMWMVVIGNLQGHEKRQMLPWVVVACQASPETFHSLQAA
jgi:hypothetical protein